MKTKTLHSTTDITPFGSCYHKIGSQCVYGYTQGRYSDCEPRTCRVALTSEDKASFDAYSSQFPCTLLQGRIYDAMNGTPLGSFPVKVLLPTGQVIPAMTDSEGKFSVAIETLEALLVRSNPNVCEMGDLPFAPNPPDSDPKQFFLITLRRTDSTGCC